MAQSNRIFLLAIATLMLLFAGNSFAQDGGDGDVDDIDINFTDDSGGIEIDADHVLTTRTVTADSRMLTLKRLKSAQASLNKKLQKTSQLRKVSLVRLEQEVARQKAAGKRVSDDVRFLAGLTRITHIFFYPDENDIVIAGPAEGFFLNGENRIVGTESGNATLHLEDLVAALRAFGPDGKKTALISCSIDPTQEGLQRLQAAMLQIKNQFEGRVQQFTVPLAQHVAKTYHDALGHQTITIKGVSNKTRFARVLAEADYRMKLYGIGAEQPPVRMTTFIEQATPSTGGSGKLQRWYFQPNYESIKVNQAGDAISLEESGVKLVAADESVSASGKRTNKGGANVASRRFCASFTKNFDKVAEAATIFGEMRNVIDMSIAAAFIQKAGLYGKANWDMSTFADESKFPIEIHMAPEKVAPVVNAVVKRGQLMTPIGGGVSIQPRVALNSDKITVETDGKIQTVRDSVKFDLAEGQWWWD